MLVDDSIYNGGVATIEGYILLRECGMYKANDNSRALAKALYNTKSFRTCAKVMYNSRTKVFNFPRPVFSLSLMFLYIEGAGNHTEGCLKCDIVSCV